MLKYKSSYGKNSHPLGSFLNKNYQIFVESTIGIESTYLEP